MDTPVVMLPRYASHDLYLAGESYAGVYVARQNLGPSVVQGPKDPHHMTT